MRKIWISISASAMAVLLLCIGVALLWTYGSPPLFEEVRASYRTSDALLLDRNRQILHEVRMERHGRRLDWVPLTEISPVMQSAIVYAEDRKFFDHRGTDWTAFGGALVGLFTSAGARGASTITMQLVSKLDDKLQPRFSRRTFWQKLKQIQAARALERRWSKAEILEAYLNLISFRGELQGVQAASRGLFDKVPHGLNEVEALILAALVRSPNAPIDQVAARAFQLAATMNVRLDRASILVTTQRALSAPYHVEPQASLAPHVALRLFGPGRTSTSVVGTEIVSTLDAQLQRFAIESLRHHLQSVRSQNVHDGAVLVVDNKTGDVLAYVGNAGDLASARYVDGVQAQRQAGSALKPFLYAFAIQERLLTAASLIDDSPLDVPLLSGIYRPENYDNRFHGLVTARTALASSLNVPAVKTLNLVGVDPFVNTLGRVGFRSLQPADFYGPSLALGSADVALWDLVGAYRCLANGGMRSALRLSFDKDSRAARERIIGEEAAFIVSDILSDRESRARTFSLESPLSTRYWSAVKTGTSKDMRDNWCVGYSSDYTVGVWVGNFSGEPMWNVSGITGAAPVWVEIMDTLHREHSSHAPKPPAGVVKRKVEFSNFHRSQDEWFLKDTETSLVREASSPASGRIVYPASGTVVALDPDIPEEQQKLFFEAQPSNGRLRWVLNGEDLGFADSLLPWSLRQGKHALSLVDEANRELDSVQFEVRGQLAIR